MIGIDLIKISRMQKLVEKFGQKALERFLSPSEIELVSNHKTAAGFWAAKEALSKALGVGIGQDCSFKDISIFKTQRGAPKLELSQKLIDAFHIKDTSLSITHDGEYAIAVVAIESTSTHKV
ncbi:MAG: holo-ACP synthase [Sulfurimonas sp.]|uniref:holo-ACP synthase n=1 Tax=Sulfurimonas sp. TaxID=2022749 RepID=UPI0025DFD4FC|nr:holo-ACP synthase [Sulfurimonas sp.]MCK9491534.1 holo-ACP synthase [Sulfurimonas sp.]